MSLYRELLHRRVFQIVGIYLGAMFVAFEFTDMIVERYELSTKLVDYILIGSLSMLPTIIMIAYFHGRPGADKWHKLEKVGIPLNVMVTAVLLGVSINTNPAEATSEIVALTDNQGNVVAEVEVPKAQYIKRVLVSFLSPKDLGSHQTWVSYGLPYLIAESLKRDEYIQSDTPFNNYANGMIWQMKRAGHLDGLNVSSLLMQELATRYGFDYYISGEVSIDETNQFKARIQLHDSDTNAILDEREIGNSDLFELANAISSTVSTLLADESQETQIRSEIKVQEILTSSIEALEVLVRGKIELLLNDTTEVAITFWQEAVTIDSEFAQAYYELADLYADNNRFEEARQPLKMAMAKNHKLDVSDRYQSQAMSYMLRGRFAKSLAVYDSWRINQPDSFEAHLNYAYALLWNGGQTEDVIASFIRALELNPRADWIYMNLAEQYQVTKDYDRAIAMLEKHHEERPNEYTSLVTIGDILTLQGKLDEAQAYYQRGSTTDAKMVTPIKKMAENSFRRGDLDLAQSHLEDIEFNAAAPRQQAVYHRTNGAMLMARGQHSLALPEYEKAWALAVSDNMFDLILDKLQYIPLYYQAGRGDEVAGIIEEASPFFAPPLDRLAELGVMMVSLAEGDLEQAEKSRIDLERTIEQMQRNDLLFKTEMTGGIIRNAQGEYAEAIGFLENALQISESSIHGTKIAIESDHYIILTELQYAYLMSGDIEKSIETGDLIRMTWPFHPQANLMLARAYLEQSDTDQARDAYARFSKVWASSEPDGLVDRLNAEVQPLL